MEQDASAPPLHPPPYGAAVSTISPYVPMSPQASSTGGRWIAPPGETDTPSFVWPDAPDTDVADNDKAREPTYKPTQAFKAIVGYEKTTIKESEPVQRPQPPQPSSSQQQFKGEAAGLAEEDAHKVLKAFVGKKLCYGKRPVEEMEIKDVAHSSAVHYSLETFIECRTTKRVHRPMRGETYPLHRKDLTPSGVWQVENPPDQIWAVDEKSIPVPNTSTIETCHACGGKGFNKCFRCKGRGKTTCKHCKASGKKGSNPCPYCHGNGRQRCFRCNGWACISCSVCEGYRKLEFYIQITSNFKVKQGDYLHNPGKKFPAKLLKDVDGEMLFEEENQMVSPLTTFPTQDVNTQSQQLLQKQLSVKTERVLLQRHRVKGIPIAEVSYTWQTKDGRYWVYSMDKRVYAPDYPHSCCCCRCVIL
ncbi:protein SSUH2 homolog isoform X2 [Amphiura filiformis]